MLNDQFLPLADEPKFATSSSLNSLDY